MRVIVVHAQAFAGCAAALAAATLALGLTDHPWLLAPFGGSCVILFGMRDGAMAQPRSLFGGYAFSALAGLVCYRVGMPLLGGPLQWWMIGSVGLALVAMMLTATIHSPAGALPIIVFMESADWAFLATPVLVGTLVLFAVALAANNIGVWRRAPRYPRRWS